MLPPIVTLDNRFVAEQQEYEQTHAARLEQFALAPDASSETIQRLSGFLASIGIAILLQCRNDITEARSIKKRIEQLDNKHQTCEITSWACVALSIVALTYAKFVGWQNSYTNAICCSPLGAGVFFVWLSMQNTKSAQQQDEIYEKKIQSVESAYPKAEKLVFASIDLNLIYLARTRLEQHSLQLAQMDPNG